MYQDSVCAVCEDPVCVVCGEPVADGQPWLMLNRYGVGNGDSHTLTEVVDDEGEYVWDVGSSEYAEEFDSDDVLGHVLHWPHCAMMFVEGEMIGLGVRNRRRTK